MASTSQVQPNFSFINGIVTEASPLTYPENATIDEENFDLDISGLRSRRLGIDFELNYQYIDTGYTYTNSFKNTPFRTYRWDNVGNDPSLSFLVVQSGGKIKFFDAFSTSQTPNEITATDISLDPNTIKNFTVVDGDLIIVMDGYGRFYRCEYDGSQIVVNSVADILVRDIWGVDDGLPNDVGLNTLSLQHEYNLKNQGWNDSLISAFFAERSTYPSNADIPSLGEKTDGSWDSNLIKGYLLGDTPAPKGRYTIDLFNRGAGRSRIVPSVGTDFTNTPGFKACGSYASRLWLAGITGSQVGGDSKTPTVTSFVLFSQLVKSKDNLNRFYQEADPTADEINEAVATDGGFISIPEASNIHKLEPIGSSLFVFAENGIWEIRGGESGFNATDYQVNKITNVGSMGPLAIVNAENSLFYFAKSGIYVIQPDQSQTMYTSQNISEQKIQKLYLSIPSGSRAKAQGVFEPEYRKVRWIYQSNSAEDKYVYNRELILDLQLGAFYKYSFSTPTTSSPQICGIYTTPNFTTLIGETDVTDSSGATVTLSDGSSVVVATTDREDAASSIKYLTVEVPSLGTWKYTIASRSNEEFRDWSTFGDNVDSPAYMVTGYNIAGDSMRHKQVPYISFHFNRTETGFDSLLAPRNPSSCLVTPYWDFADSATSGKIGTQFEAYRLNRNYIPSGTGDLFSYGQAVVSTKSKLRGRGKALSLRIDTQEGYDCQLLGWSLLMTGNTVV